MCNAHTNFYKVKPIPFQDQGKKNKTYKRTRGRTDEQQRQSKLNQIKPAVTEVEFQHTAHQLIT